MKHWLHFFVNHTFLQADYFKNGTWLFVGDETEKHPDHFALRWRPTEVDGPAHSLWKRSGPGQEDNDVVDGSRIENVEEDMSVVYLLHVRLDLESKWVKLVRDGCEN